jgi:hypothetical protein
MLFELGGSLLLGVSITLLKDFDGLIPFPINPDQLLSAAFVPPLADFVANFYPLYFTNSACHFLAPGNPFIFDCISLSIIGRRGCS